MHLNKNPDEYKKVASECMKKLAKAFHIAKLFARKTFANGLANREEEVNVRDTVLFHFDHE